MKKRENKMLLMLVILCVLICALLLIKIMTPPEEEIVVPEEKVLMTFDATKVTNLAWEYDGQKLSFTYNGNGKWSYDDNAEATAVHDTLNRMVSYLNDTKVSRTIESPDALSAYGLEDPICTVWLTVDGTEYEVRIGNTNDVTTPSYEDINDVSEFLKGDYYLSIGDGKVYMEGGEVDLLDSFDVKFTDIVLLPETEETETSEAAEATEEAETSEEAEETEEESNS